MDFSLDTVAQKCASQLQSYQDCIIQNQKGDWSNICKSQREALTKCADDNVPQLKAVKTNCGHIITQYDQCLQANKNASDETLERECISSLKALYDCTDNVMNSFK